MTYALALSRQQIEFLLETVQAFVDNKKLLHLPDINGNIIRLPLTEEALEFINSQFTEQEGKREVLVRVGQLSDHLSKVRIEMNETLFEYQVDMREFDEQ